MRSENIDYQRPLLQREKFNRFVNRDLFEDHPTSKVHKTQFSNAEKAHLINKHQQPIVIHKGQVKTRDQAETENLTNLDEVFQNSFRPSPQPKQNKGRDLKSNIVEHPDKVLSTLKKRIANSKSALELQNNIGYEHILPKTPSKQIIKLVPIHPENGEIDTQE